LLEKYFGDSLQRTESELARRITITKQEIENAEADSEFVEQIKSKRFEVEKYINACLFERI
jgi:hypothetical protein